MSVEETLQIDLNQASVENQDGFNKPDSTEESGDESSSPRGVLETPESDTSSVSEEQIIISTNTSNSTSVEKSAAQCGGGGGGAFGYGIPWKAFMNGMKKTPLRKFSTSTIALLTSYELASRKSLTRKLARIRSAEDGVDYGLLPMAKPSWRNFEYAELVSATDDFSPERLLGKGGHAEVYKGSLPDGSVVAVKRLIKEDKEDAENEAGGSSEDEIRTADFLSELGIIAHIDHPNSAKLIGYCLQGSLFLVLQLCAHGSLASHLHGSGEFLEWKLRYRVALGVAEGLSYLHHSCPRRIIHRDIKASNILLDEDYEPLISDYGLAKWLPDKWLHHVLYPIEGTFGYLAPEYFMHGIVDEKTDVFAFGVLLLELITGRHAVDSSRQSLVIWAKPLLDCNNMAGLVDQRLGTDYDPAEMKRIMHIASLCIHHVPGRRPHMNKVVQLLKGEGGPIEIKQKSIAPRSVILDACDLEDYTNSNYLNDLNRHRELVME
ncbi:hypothetical protein Drorol1_Dr00005247 [Drosera rotundifolia]